MNATYTSYWNPYNYEHRDELITTEYIAKPSIPTAVSTQFIAASIFINITRPYRIFWLGESATTEIITPPLRSPEFPSSPSLLRSSSPWLMPWSPGSKSATQQRIVTHDHQRSFNVVHCHIYAHSTDLIDLHNANPRINLSIALASWSLQFQSSSSLSHQCLHKLVFSYSRRRRVCA